jgi:Tol biopolymer transport system component
MPRRSRMLMMTLIAALTAVLLPMVSALAAFPGQPNTIVFWTARNGSADLYTMKANGNGQQPVGSGFAGAFPGQLSPDGSRVTFVSDSGVGTGFDVWVADIDGSNAMELTSFDGFFFDPSWNPAGTKIVFSVFTDTTSSLDVFTVNANGGTPVQITHTPAINEYQPVWSPNGKSIVVSANNDRDAVFNYDLYRYDRDGHGRTRLTHTPKRYEGSPDFRADGKRISFTTYTDASGLSDVMTMRADGSDVRNLTKRVDLEVTFAVWLPNGHVAFGGRPEGEDLEVWTISSGGTGLDQLTDNDVDDDVSEQT